MLLQGANSPPWVHLAEAHLGRTLTPDEEKCPPIGQYNQIDCPSGSHAHHIVPDMCYRTGTRGSSAPRVPNAPSLGEGMCICLTHSQHSNLHSSLNSSLRAMGTAPVPAPSGLTSGANSVTGTAPIDQIQTACAHSINTIPNLPDECKDLANEMTSKQVADRGIGDSPGRTTTSLPNGDAVEVIGRGILLMFPKGLRIYSCHATREDLFCVALIRPDAAQPFSIIFIHEVGLPQPWSPSILNVRSFQSRWMS